MRRHRYGQSGKKEELQKIFLLYLIGFFIGAVMYYIFQQSFQELRKQLEDNLMFWSQRGENTMALLGKSIWQHGKYLFLFLVFMIGPLVNLYQNIFSWYTGVRNGFLLMFFLYARGGMGIVFYVFSLIPHVFLLVPLYLHLFLNKKENRQEKHKLLRWSCVILVFITACILEVKANLPLMEKFL